MEREVIFTEDVERIFGPRPWKSRTDILMEEEALKLADQRTRQLEAEAQAKTEAEANADAEANATEITEDSDNGNATEVAEENKPS